MDIMKELRTNIKYVYSLISLFLTVCLTGCLTSTNHDDCYIICFQTSSIQNCYIIRIHKDTISTSVGQRSASFLRYIYNNKRIPLNTLSLDTIVKRRNQPINKEKWSKLNNELEIMAKGSEINDFYPGGSNDAWGTIILYGGKQYAVEYPTSNKTIDSIIKQVKDLSPIRLFEKEYTVSIPLY